MTSDSRPLLLYVTDSEGLGGAEGYLRTLLQHADQQRYRIALALPPRPATRPLVDFARSHDVAVSFLDLVHRNGLSPAAIARSAALLRWLRPKIVHFNLPAPRRCVETLLASALVGVPRRLVTFQLVMPAPRFGRLVGWARGLNRRLQYRTVHQGIVVSEGNRRLLVEQYGFPPERLALIPNAVDTERFHPRPDDGVLRATWGIPPGAPLLGVVGRLTWAKGHDLLFDALPQIWSRWPAAHVALVGAGELEASLRERAAQIDPEGRIHFVGQQQDMPRVLAALDLFVLPSRYEGMPFAVLEAMAMERAVVASAVDGVVEVIKDGRDGVLVPRGAVEPLGAAITRLLGDEALRLRLGHAARQTVTARFDQRQMLEHTFAFYE